MTAKPAGKGASRYLDIAIIALLVFVVSQYLLPKFFGDDKVAPLPVEMTMQDASLIPGQDPIVNIKNNLPTPLSIPATCPRPPLTISYSADGTSSGSLVDPGEPIVECEDVPTIAAGASAQISLSRWKYTAFAKDGIYVLTLEATTGSGDLLTAIQPVSVKASVGPQGVFGKTYATFITRPFLNFLVLVATILPDHNLGIAIILLTLLVKIILFIPTQHSLEGQKKMQLLQPQIEEMRKKHADDPQLMNKEIMRIWKENKINPFQSCLPILLQFPILIGLYHVFRDTSHLFLSRHLLYGQFQTVDWTFNTGFLGLDLSLTNALLFAPLLVIMQFIQMKLTFYIADKKKAAKIDAAVHQKDNPQDMQQKIMLYVLPLMIGFFAFQVPSAVSLYWGVSTVFAIGQQLIVNREHLKVRA